jgi:hypothetical protein
MRFTTALLPLALAAAPAHAAVLDFTFSQSGFPGGGQITGFFSGEDLDGDGQLSSFADEISAFGASFSGNDAISAFTLGFDDLFGLVYDLGDPLLGDGTTGDIEGIFAENANGTYEAGAGPLGLPNGCQADGVCGRISQGEAATESGAFVEVGTPAPAVPEPATWAMMVGGFGLAGAAVRARRRMRPALA